MRSFHGGRKRNWRSTFTRLVWGWKLEHTNTSTMERALWTEIMVQVVQSTNTKQTLGRQTGDTTPSSSTSVRIALASSLNRRGKFIVFLMLGKRKNRSKTGHKPAISRWKKKSKDKAKAHSTASETDEVFEALEMAEDVGSKLEAVLKKIWKAWYCWKPLEPDAHNTSKYWRKCKQAGFGSGRSRNKVQTACLNSQWNWKKASNLMFESSRNNVLTWRLTQGGKMWSLWGY